ncbi:MAG: large subunit ribosomal protein L21 [Granulosicoccus sp.]|jgi:large subunit ribosomal protein L21
MYAIVDIAGQQFKVEKDSKLYVHRLEGKEGSKVSFDKVLLVDDNGKVSVGTPNVEGMAVSAKIVSHLRDDKILVFKKKRRKGFQKSNGHRQDITEIVIEGIGKGAAKNAAAPKAEKAAAPKAEAKVAAPKAEKKEAAPKAEKPVAKKAAPEKDETAEK